jgi:arsenate reductase-like glutaredoxin family protein
MTVYGIKNCNMVKSAIDWLNKNKVDFVFHDYKKSGITAEKLSAWSKQVGWENLQGNRF